MKCQNRPLDSSLVYPDCLVVKVRQDSQIINKKAENEQIRQGKTSDNWTANKRCQKDTDATRAKKYGNSDFGYKLTVNVDAKYKVTRQTAPGTASVHDSRRFGQSQYEPGYLC